MEKKKAVRRFLVTIGLVIASALVVALLDAAENNDQPTNSTPNQPTITQK